MPPLDTTGGAPRPGRPDAQLNVLGGKLASCSTDPLTGFTRSGCCDAWSTDPGSHTICAVLTEDFLAFSRNAGNDLSTPQPQYGFPGLKPGQRWCLCAPRWQEALEAGCAPRVVLEATNLAALRYCTLEDLERHSADQT